MKYLLLRNLFFLRRGSSKHWAIISGAFKKLPKIQYGKPDFDAVNIESQLLIHKLFPVTFFSLIQIHYLEPQLFVLLTVNLLVSLNMFWTSFVPFNSFNCCRSEKATVYNFKIGRGKILQPKKLWFW